LALSSYRRAVSLCLELKYFQHAAGCLESLANLRWRLKPGSLDAVRWLAAAACWRERVKMPIDPTDQTRVDRLSQQMHERGIFCFRRTAFSGRCFSQRVRTRLQSSVSCRRRCWRFQIR
jgi:hypothetical protein